MKFSLKKLAFIIILSASIPLLLSHWNLIFESLFLSTSNLNPNYATQVKSKLNTINKNKNDIEELALEIKSKKNDLALEATSVDNIDKKAISSEIEDLKLDEKNMRNLMLQYENIASSIRQHKKNDDYSTLLKDMNNLISLQNSKYTLLKKLNLDLDTALGVLK